VGLLWSFFWCFGGAAAGLVCAGLVCVGPYGVRRHIVHAAGCGGVAERSPPVGGGCAAGESGCGRALGLPCGGAVTDEATLPYGGCWTVPRRRAERGHALLVPAHPVMRALFGGVRG